MLGSGFDRGGVTKNLVADDSPAVAMTSFTRGSPRVSVPVLSNATTRTSASRSRWAPPLMSTPFLAAAESAATIETGVEITSAQGQAMTRSTSER